MPPRDLVLLATLALLMLGAIIVQSAGMTVTQPGTTADLATNRAVLLALAAGAAFWVGRQTPTRWLHSPVVAIAAIGVAILLLAVVLLPGIGARVNGARRWIDLGPIGFQPSEIAKWAMILFMAWFASSRRGTLAEFKSGLGPALIVVALVCGLTIIEDLGTAVLIGAVAALLLLSAGARIAHFAIIALPAIGVLATAVVLEPYRLQRLQTFINPWADPADSGYHVIQSLKAIAGGRLGGRGLGNGIQKFGYLPEDTTDFVFAIVTEELGIAGCLLVVALITSILWAGWRIIQIQINPARQLLALGIVATFTCQAIINLLVVTGLAPTKGIALPLVSSGGTGWILTAFMLGALYRLDPTSRTRAISQAPTSAPELDR